MIGLTKVKDGKHICLQVRKRKVGNQLTDRFPKYKVHYDEYGGSR